MILLMFTLGALVGFLIGVVFRDALDLYRDSRKDQPMACRALDRRYLAIILIVSLLLNAGVAYLLYATRKSAQEYTQCTAAWQQQFGEAYRARVDAAVKVDGALDGVVRAVAAEDREAFKRALHTYVALRDRQAEKRRQHPLPPLPETLCGSAKEVRR